LISPVQSSYAQTREAVLEEVIVTSRRYEETVEDAPVAVNVLSGQALKANRIDRADDILNYTPGATWESFSKVQPVAAMRGVVAPTPGNSSSEASIQTVVDNVVISKDFMKAPPLFDLKRIEVLRGPQGTSFGRNASVGLIHFVTNRPTQESSKSISATIGSDELYELDGHFNGALNKNWSGRLAYNIDSQDGPTESISTGEGLDGDSNSAIRGSLLYQPTDNFSAYFKLEHSKDRDDAPVRHGLVLDNAANANAGITCEGTPYVGGRDTGQGPYRNTFFDDCGDPFKTEISSGFDFHLDRNITTAAAELVWNLDNGIAVTSITGYMDGDNDAFMDLIGSPNDVAFQVVTNDGNSFSQEIRIDNASSDSSLRWLVGAYYLQDEEDRFEENQFQPTTGARLGPFVPTFLATFSNNETTSKSIFGEVTWSLSERASLTYGGRFVDDEKDYTYGVRVSGVNRQLGGVPGVGPGIDGVAAVCNGNNMGPPAVCGSRANPLGFTGEQVSDSWDDYISKLSFSYELNDVINLYALYSEGFKSGTFQPDARSRTAVNVIVQPESSTNFEIGLKGTTSSSRYSVTLFQLDVDDVQTINLVPVGAGFTGLISNVGSISTSGIEADGTFILNENFLVGGNFALLDSELQDTFDPSGNGVDISGQRPPAAPDWTFLVFGEYTKSLASGGSISLRTDVRGRSDVYFQNSNRDTDLRLRPEVINMGANVSWTNAADDLNVSLWIKNINEDVDVENFGPPSPCCSTFATGFRNKRTFGVSVNYDW
jgi:iron complex outermembrane receptor protein